MSYLDDICLAHFREHEARWLRYKPCVEKRWMNGSLKMRFTHNARKHEKWPSGRAGRVMLRLTSLALEAKFSTKEIA